MFNSALYDPSQQVIIVDLMTLSQQVIIVDFWFVHLKWNKFETSLSFVKSYLIEHHLLFDNKSKDILNAFDLVLMINCFEIDMRKFC